MVRRELLLGCALAAVVGCGDPTIRVYVYGNAGDSGASVELRVLRADDERYEDAFEGVPASLLLENADTSDERDVIVSLVANTPYGVVTRSANLDFADRDVLLPMALCRDCADVACGPEQTCIRGACKSYKVDETELDEDEGEPPDDDECSEGAGGSGGSGGSGGTCTGTCRECDPATCPIERPDTWLNRTCPFPGSCIDSFEVPRREYFFWLAQNPAPANPAPGCENADFTAVQSDLDAACQGDCENHPVVGISWCAADAYCRWAEKRLCSPDEWMAACGAPNMTAYPYGDVYQPDTCNGADHTSVVGTWPFDQNGTCRSGDLYDMSGNAAEWVTDQSYRGGHYQSPEMQLTCSDYFASSDGAPSATIGFRCCSAE